MISCVFLARRRFEMDINVHLGGAGERGKEDGGRWFQAPRMGDSRPMGTPEAFVLAVARFLKAEPAAVQSFSVFTRLGKVGEVIYWLFLFVHSL